MPVPDFDDRALDALLSGVPSAQSGLDWLVPFVEELGTVASAPAPVVRPALAVLLREGLPVDTGDEPAPQPAAGRPTGRKTNTRARELIAGLAGRLAGLGLVAKAGLGLTLAAASTAAAGAAGALPAPAQHAVATVVRAATPFTFPDQASSKGRAGAPGTPGVDPTARTDATGASGGSGGSGGVDGKAKDQRATEGSSEPVTVPPAAGTGAGAHTGAHRPRPGRPDACRRPRAHVGPEPARPARRPVLERAVHRRRHPCRRPRPGRRPAHQLARSPGRGSGRPEHRGHLARRHPRPRRHARPPLAPDRQEPGR